MGLFSRFFRDSGEADAVSRREMILRKGRITEGRIIDIEEVGKRQQRVRYEYTVNGVRFESFDFLTEEQQAEPALYGPGAVVSVRYEPGNQVNSVIV